MHLIFARIFVFWYTQTRHSWSQIYRFWFLRVILHFDKFQGANFKYENSSLKLVPKSRKIRQFVSQIWNFVLQKFCRLHKFKRTDFKYVNSFLRFWSNNALLVWNFSILSYSRDLTVWKTFKLLISNFTLLFWNDCLEIPNKTFLVPILRILIFARIFAIFLNSRELISNMTICFRN